MSEIYDGLMSWYVYLKLLLKKRFRRNARELAIGNYLRLCLEGFLPNKQQVYSFAQYGKAPYLSDQQMLKTAYINGMYSRVLTDKRLFESTMGPFVNVPKNYACVEKGRFVPLVSEIREPDDVAEKLVQEKNLIVKPTYGVGGKGVCRLQYEGKRFVVNGQEKHWDEIVKVLLTSGDIILCEYVRQGDFSNNLYPHTVNTIRMLSMRDPASGKAFIGAAVFRIGASLSVPVDNVSAGGIVCDIDLASGRLGKAAHGFYRTVSWLEKHPDTGVCFKGQHIPGWQQICKSIQRVADNFPQLPYIAWDVAVGDDDIFVIEANHWSDVSIFQVYRPLLLDSRIKLFFRYHKII